MAKDRSVQFEAYRRGERKTLPGRFITDPADPRHGTTAGRNAHRRNNSRCDRCNPGKGRKMDGLPRIMPDSPAKQAARRRALEREVAAWRRKKAKEKREREARLAEPKIPRRDEVDEIVVDRILGGDWALARTATRAERERVCFTWAVHWGYSLRKLEGLTGWRADRYFTWKDYRREAS